MKERMIKFIQVGVLLLVAGVIFLYVMGYFIQSHSKYSLAADTIKTTTTLRTLPPLPAKWKQQYELTPKGGGRMSMYSSPYNLEQTRAVMDDLFMKGGWVKGQQKRGVCLYTKGMDECVLSFEKNQWGTMVTILHKLVGVSG